MQSCALGPRQTTVADPHDKNVDAFADTNGASVVENSHSKEHTVVGAIDFGTSYTGYAYNLKDQNDTVTERWTPGHVGLEKEKTPTCILFNKNKNFVAFGYEAENRYAQICQEGQAKDYYFFQGYKMSLYKKTQINKSFTIKDVHGREFQLQQAVSETLRYMKERLVADIKIKSGIELSSQEDILYVLTVPAIWSDAAKGFMRSAAELAGIPSERLLICLEPEAAAIFCKAVSGLSVNSKFELQKYLSNFQDGCRYIIIDAGGGTVDIVAHEVGANGAIRELHPACGGDGGGSAVDENFLLFLKQVYGADVMEDFERKEPEDYFYLLREFEANKQFAKGKIQPNNTLQIRIPTSLNKIREAKQYHRRPEPNIEEDGFHFNQGGDKMFITYRKFNSFFEMSLENIINQVSQVLLKEDLKEISTIVLVGGYAQSELLKDALEKKFKLCTIIRPHRACSAVLRGAVMFGRDPSIISERRCRYTYGIKANLTFDKTIHKMSTRYTDEDGETRARNCFDIHAKVGQNVKTGVFQSLHSYFPEKQTQTNVQIPLFISSENNPVYTDDYGCEKIGELEVDLRGLKGPCKEKELAVALCFGNTEITVKAIVKQTGKELSSKIDYGWHM